MSIVPLPPNTMALAAAANTAPARPSGEMNTDKGGQPREDEFVAALEAASSSAGPQDATVTERTDETERPKKTHEENDTGHRAMLIGQAWHPTRTGLPAADAAGALALPAALIAHGTLAAGHPLLGDISSDTPPVAVVGIGVVTESAPAEGAGTDPTGPAVQPPSMFALAAVAQGLPTAQPPARPVGVPALTVVPAGGARPAVTAALGDAAAALGRTAGGLPGTAGIPGTAGVPGSGGVPGTAGVPGAGGTAQRLGAGQGLGAAPVTGRPALTVVGGTGAPPVPPGTSPAARAARLLAAPTATTQSTFPTAAVPAAATPIRAVAPRPGMPMPSAATTAIPMTAAAAAGVPLGSVPTAGVQLLASQVPPALRPGAGRPVGASGYGATGAGPIGAAPVDLLIPTAAAVVAGVAGVANPERATPAVTAPIVASPGAAASAPALGSLAASPAAAALATAPGSVTPQPGGDPPPPAPGAGAPPTAAPSADGIQAGGTQVAVPQAPTAMPIQPGVGGPGSGVRGRIGATATTKAGATAARPTEPADPPAPNAAGQPLVPPLVPPGWPLPPAAAPQPPAPVQPAGATALSAIGAAGGVVTDASPAAARRGADEESDRGAGAGLVGPDPNLLAPQPQPVAAPALPAIDLPAASQPAPTSTPTPAAQVADQIIPLRSENGVHRIAMELRPNDLGTVSVVAEIRNGHVHLHFGGANEMTREALRAALPELRQQLENAGFADAGFDFGDSPANQSAARQFGAAGQDGGGNQGGRGNRGDDAPAPAVLRPTAPRPAYADRTPPAAGRPGLDLQV